MPKSESEISAAGFQACIHWMERTYIESSLELMRNDNQAVYNKIDISKSYYFKRKKAIGLTTEQGSETTNELLT